MRRNGAWTRTVVKHRGKIGEDSSIAEMQMQQRPARDSTLGLLGSFGSPRKPPGLLKKWCLNRHAIESRRDQSHRDPCAWTDEFEFSIAIPLRLTFPQSRPGLLELLRLFVQGQSVNYGFEIKLSQPVVQTYYYHGIFLASHRFVKPKSSAVPR